jgi:protein FRA10AC1
VLSGAGENTCGNSRCKHENRDEDVHLNTLELPFAYEEHGKRKSALVKVVLCPRCLKKLMWKRNKEKEAGQPATPLDGPVEHRDEGVEDEGDDMRRLRRSKGRVADKRESMTREAGPSTGTRRRSSRSRSPRHRDDKHRDRSRRRRSPSLKA